MKQTLISNRVYKASEFDFVDYEPSKHKEQLINVLVEAYLFNNPQFVMLNLTKEQMREEVIQQIDNNEYCALVIHKETQEVQQYFINITKQIAALAFCTESQVYRKHERVDITKCPNRNSMRHYLRQASIQDALENFNFQKGYIGLFKIFYPGVCCFSNGFTIAKKYMGQSMGDILTLCLFVKFSERGYQYVLGNAINDKAKIIFSRMDSIVKKKLSVGVVDVGQLVCLDTMEKPYEGKGLTYEAFLITTNGSGKKAQDRLRQQARL